MGGYWSIGRLDDKVNLIVHNLIIKLSVYNHQVLFYSSTLDSMTSICDISFCSENWLSVLILEVCDFSTMLPHPFLMILSNLVIYSLILCILVSYFWRIGCVLIDPCVDLYSVYLKWSRFLSMRSTGWSNGDFCLCSSYW